MNYLGSINNRSVHYRRHDPGTNWSGDLQKENWLLFAFVETVDEIELAKVSTVLIEYNGCYACCSGHQGNFLHSIIDMDLVMREIDGNYLLPFDVVMTTDNIDLEEELWFAIYAAHNDPEIINKIICLDLSKNGIEGDLKDLLFRFNN